MARAIFEARESAIMQIPEMLAALAKADPRAALDYALRLGGIAAPTTTSPVGVAAPRSFGPSALDDLPPRMPPLTRPPLPGAGGGNGHGGPAK